MPSLPPYRSFDLEIPEGRFQYTITLDDDGGTGWLVKRITVVHGVNMLIVQDIPQLPHWRNSPRPPKSKDHRLMKPAFIGRIIRKAIEAGWKFEEKTGQFTLSLREHPVA